MAGVRRDIDGQLSSHNAAQQSTANGVDIGSAVQQGIQIAAGENLSTQSATDVEVHWINSIKIHLLKNIFRPIFRKTVQTMLVFSIQSSKSQIIAMVTRRWSMTTYHTKPLEMVLISCHLRL